MRPYSAKMLSDFWEQLRTELILRHAVSSHLNGFLHPDLTDWLARHFTKHGPVPLLTTDRLLAGAPPEIAERAIELLNAKMGE